MIFVGILLDARGIVGMTQRGSDGKQHYNIFRTCLVQSAYTFSPVLEQGEIAVVAQSHSSLMIPPLLGSEGNRDRRGGRARCRPGEVRRRELLESFQAWPAGSPCSFPNLLTNGLTKDRSCCRMWLTPRTRSLKESRGHVRFCEFRNT